MNGGKIVYVTDIQFTRIAKNKRTKLNNINRKVLVKYNVDT